MNNEPHSKATATVAMVEEADAKGVVLEVYKDIKATKEIDFVPNFWKTIASHPPLLEQTWRNLKQTMAAGELDSLTKEMIALAVSITNGCDYCINSHTAACQKLGLSEKGLGELMAVVGLFNTTNAVANGYQIQPDVFPSHD